MLELLKILSHEHSIDQDVGCVITAPLSTNYVVSGRFCYLDVLRGDHGPSLMGLFYQDLELRSALYRQAFKKTVTLKLLLLLLCLWPLWDKA